MSLAIQDDPDLLNLMMADSRRSGEEFRASNYWQRYEASFLPELTTLGLADFRRRPHSVLSSFGATDLYPGIMARYPLWARLIPAPLQRWLECTYQATRSYARRRRETLRLLLEWACAYGRDRGCADFMTFKGSLVGSPEDYLAVHDGYYTLSHINYYLQYCFCAQAVNFKEINVIAELGAGSGKQVEVLYSLFPDKTYLIFDIPPQLYVAEQYLKAIFGDRVISYRVMREMKSLTDVAPGSIGLLAASQMTLLPTLRVDLFWNSASFQEMEPAQVQNYLALVTASCQAVYLRELTEGQYVARQPGAPGVIRPTSLKEYVNGLRAYRLESFQRSVGLGSGDLMTHPYYDMLFRRDPGW